MAGWRQNHALPKAVKGNLDMGQQWPRRIAYVPSIQRIGLLLFQTSIERFRVRLEVKVGTLVWSKISIISARSLDMKQISTLNPPTERLAERKERQPPFFIRYKCARQGYPTPVQ
jgi:hypothetical protein